MPDGKAKYTEELWDVLDEVEEKVPAILQDLLYDYGDNWEFTIKLERVEPPGTKIKVPRIMERHGKAPEQYPEWD